MVSASRVRAFDNSAVAANALTPPQTLLAKARAMRPGDDGDEDLSAIDAALYAADAQEEAVRALEARVAALESRDAAADGRLSALEKKVGS